MTYTVGEMAQAMNIPASTLRYYDKEGLLPFVERSPGGIRLFREKDYEWLQVIHCLKKTGMSLKDIRTFIGMAMQGDETIGQRLQLFLKQREAVLEQMAALQDTLATLDFKCWYYETAERLGSTAAVWDTPVEEIPERYRNIHTALCQPPRTAGV